ncbi:MAG: ABC transporter ATP-binding protein [Clostridiales bacterium]|nr:ABC transporter ATP-binding protein [Clostridiales bacterium]
MAEVMIETRGLGKKYGSFTAVRDLNLSVQKGEVFGLLGPNGAGKTTTTLMLLGLTEPSVGSAQIAGVDCTRNPLRVKQIVGYLPDNMGFYPDMTGRENLRMTGRMNGLHGELLEERMDELLARVGMSQAADKTTSTYSKGMKQRLGIADILMKDPDVLIMDEPTNGIDPEGMRELMLLIRELAEKDGRTILISSHQLHQIQQICDRVGIFVHGELVACGDIATLGKQLEEQNGYQFEIAVGNQQHKLRKVLESMEQVDRLEEKEAFILIHTGENIAGKLMHELMKEKLELTHLRKCSGDLDEIYSLYFEKAGESDAGSDDRKKRRKQAG